MWCLSGWAGSVASGAACALCVDLLMNPLINISCSDAMASMHRIGVTSRGPACRTERCRVSCSASPPGAPSKFATCSCNGDAGNACVRRQPQVAPPPPLPPPLPPAAHAEFPSFHLAPQDRLGTYQRPDYTFQQQIGGPGLPLEPGRYHLYVGNACPWCHRVLLALTLTGLEPFVGWVLSLAAQSGGRAHPATEACWQSCTR